MPTVAATSREPLSLRRGADASGEPLWSNLLAKGLRGAKVADEGKTPFAYKLLYRRRSFPWQPATSSSHLRHAFVESSNTQSTLEFDLDVPLMAAGLTSTAAVRLSAQLRNAFADADVQSTLIFEFPTARAIATHLQSVGTGGAHSAAGVEGIHAVVQAMVKDLTSSNGSSAGGGSGRLPAAADHRPGRRDDPRDIPPRIRRMR